MKTQSQTIEPQRLLKQELQRRCEKNPNYSMRAFAKALGVSHTFLSMLLKGKRPFTAKMFERIIDVLNLSPKEQKRLLGKLKVDESHHLSIDAFSIISEWYYYGILNLMKLPTFQSNPKWIAKRLGISEVQVSLAIDRLKRIEFIEEDSEGNWHRTIPNIKIDNQTYSAACRKFQSQVLSKAKESLENDGFEQRAIESFTLTMDSSQIPYARQRLREVSKMLSDEFENFGNQNEVYNLGIQIYPISKNGEKK